MMVSDFTYTVRTLSRSEFVDLRSCPSPGLHWINTWYRGNEERPPLVVFMCLLVSLVAILSR